MTELPPLYGYYIVRDYMYMFQWQALKQDLAFGTCALEILIKELEKGNVIVHITLRDHD